MDLEYDNDRVLKLIFPDEQSPGMMICGNFPA